MLTFSLAVPEQAETLKTFLWEVQQWLFARNLSQWSKAFPERWILAEIHNKHFYVVKQEDTLVATFRLLYTDPTFWGNDTTSALYLHTLAVSRAARGQHIGRQILDWSVAKARSENLTLFRLDCLANNPFLVQYYASYGFQFVRLKWVNESEYVLYELPLI